uniref:Uncharacterized protein n=1 Tax=viral metagenome TaxID=1070528 RepID=A0A6C0KS39_9ZZZZ
MNYDDNPNFIKVDDSKIINEKCIRWVKKIDECLEICTRSAGCDMVLGFNCHKVCKKNNPDSYEKLNKYFE